MGAKAKTVQVRLTKAERDLWAKLATQDGRTLSGWIRWLCNQAVKR